MNSRSKRGEARQLGCWLLPGPERIMARHPCSRKADSRLLDARTFWKNARREGGEVSLSNPMGCWRGIIWLHVMGTMRTQERGVGLVTNYGARGERIGIGGDGNADARQLCRAGG
jgi:hypothetical protein